MQNCVFLSSLDNFLLRNVIVFIFRKQIVKWRSFEKRALFDLLFTFLVTREKIQIFLQHISQLTLMTLFFALSILQKLQVYCVWFLFGMIPGVDSYSCHFGAISG